MVDSNIQISTKDCLPKFADLNHHIYQKEIHQDTLNRSWIVALLASIGQFTHTRCYSLSGYLEQFKRNRVVKMFLSGQLLDNLKQVMFSLILSKCVVSSILVFSTWLYQLKKTSNWVDSPPQQIELYIFLCNRSNFR